MNDIKIIEQILNDAKIWVAIVGFLGVITGAVITAVSNFAIEWWKRKPKRNLDSQRKKLLKTMLEDEKWPKKWRYLDTLSAVVGTDENETKRLLIEIDARGHEINDGRWGLVKYHPLSDTKE